MGSLHTIRLGLDVSSTLVGYSVFKGTKLHTYGKFRPEGPHHGAKLKSFYEFLQQLLAKHTPDDVILEMPFRGSSYAVLSMYVGVVLMAHAEVLGYELPSRNKVRPVDVKRRLGLPSKQTHEQNKRNMLRYINRTYGLRLRFRRNTKTRTSDDDIADAIGLVHVWLLREGFLNE